MGATRGPDLSGNTMQDFQAVGGYGLTKTIAGLSFLGQTAVGFFNTLAKDKEAYNRAFYDEETGKAGFNLKRFGGVFGNALQQGVGQGMRTFSANNLGEFGQNYVSGAELLKNLPGVIGEAFSVDDARTRIGTGTLGFLLELALDPAGFVGSGATTFTKARGALTGAERTVTRGGRIFGSTVLGSTGARDALLKTGMQDVSLYSAAGGIAQGLAKRMGAGEATQQFTRKVVGNAAIGNVVAAPAIISTRALVGRTQNMLYKVAQNGDHPFQARAANLLDFFFSPTASADEATRKILPRVVAMEEELPRLISQAGEAQQALLTRVKGKAAKKEVSDKLFPELMASVGTEAYGTTLKKFEKYGLPAHDVESIAQTYIRGHLSLIDVLKESSPDVAEALKLNPAHLPFLYRLNMGGRIEADHLSYLTKLNTPASWELRQGGTIRSRLESLLSGATPNRAEFFTMPGGNPYWTERSILKQGLKRSDVQPGDTVLNTFNPRDNAAVGGAFATAGKENPTPAGINTGVPGGQQGIDSMLATAQGPTPNPFGAPVNVTKPKYDPE